MWGGGGGRGVDRGIGNPVISAREWIRPRSTIGSAEEGRDRHPRHWIHRPCTGAFTKLRLRWPLWGVYEPRLIRALLYADHGRSGCG